MVTRLKEENVSGGGDGVNQKEEQRLCLFTVGVRQHTAAACVRRVEVYVRLNAWQMSRAHQGSSPAAMRTGSHRATENRLGRSGQATPEQKVSSSEVWAKGAVDSI